MIAGNFASSAGRWFTDMESFLKPFEYKDLRITIRPRSRRAAGIFLDCALPSEGGGGHPLPQAPVAQPLFIVVKIADNNALNKVRSWIGAAGRCGIACGQNDTPGDRPHVRSGSPPASQIIRRRGSRRGGPAGR